MSATLQMPTEAGRIATALLFALAPAALTISHSTISFVLVPLALIAVLCSGRARLAAADLLQPLPITALSIGILGLISALWAPDRAIATDKSLTFLLIVVPAMWLGALLLRTGAEERRHRFESLLLWGFVAAVALLGAQIFTHSLFVTHVFGPVADARIALIKLNVSSAGLAILVWAALGVLLRESANRPLKLAAAVALFACLAVIVFAGKGLAPKLALLLGAAAWFASRISAKLTAGAVGIGICTLALALLIVPTQFYQSEGFSRFRGLDSSAKYRVDIWDNAAQWIKQRPALGYGAGASQLMPPRTEISKVTHQPRSIPLYPHNVLIQIMLELGMAGLLCLLAFFAFLLRAAVRLSPPLRPFALASLTSAAAIWMIGYPLWRSAWLAWLAFCVLVFIAAERTQPAVAGAPG